MLSIDHLELPRSWNTRGASSSFVILLGRNVCCLCGIFENMESAIIFVTATICWRHVGLPSIARDVPPTRSSVRPRQIAFVDPIISSPASLLSRTAIDHLPFSHWILTIIQESTIQIDPNKLLVHWNNVFVILQFVVVARNNQHRL